MAVPAKFGDDVQVVPLPAGVPAKFGDDVKVEPDGAPQPNSVLGGIGRRTVDTLKGIGSLTAPPKGAEWLAGPALPLVRMAKGAVQSGVQAGKQAVHQAKEASQIAPGNKELKTLAYLRAATTGVSALDPLASGSVTNINELEDQGRSREAVGQAIPDAALLAAGSERGRAAIKSLSRGTLDAMAGTGPRTTKNLVKDTQAANVARDAYSNTHAAVETAREAALKTGNEKYSTVRAALNPVEVRPGFYNDLEVLSTENMPGSKGTPTILRSIAKRAASEEPLRYEDLQADYSTLGKELTKGTLDGTTFHAYDQIHEAIGKEMQGIADQHGMGAELRAAQDYWRRMKQAFGKPHNPSDAATSALTETSPEVAKAKAKENQVRLMGSFDPEIPGKFSKLQTLTDAAKGKLDSPEKIGASEVQDAKTESLAKRADSIRNRGGTWANTFVILDAIRNAISGNVEGIGKDIAVRGVFGAGKVGIAKMLENPGVAKFLTQATDRDVAQIPPELRGDFPKIAEAAKAKGIKVSPAILALATPKKRVASALSPQ